LKNQPKEIIEISSFSKTDLFSVPDSIFIFWLNEPFKETFTYRSISFDSSGFILKEDFYSPQFDSMNHDQFGRQIRENKTINDSLVIITFNEYMPEAYTKRVYLLNKDNYIIKKIVGPPMFSVDSIIRDNKNRILKVYSRGNGIDDYYESVTEYVVNEFGDPIREIKSGKTIEMSFNETYYWSDTLYNSYIYDPSGNWILKTISNCQNNFNTVVERKISY